MRRRGLDRHAQDYGRLIRAEIGSIIHDLETGQLDTVFAEMRQALSDFLAEQTGAVLGAAADAPHHLQSKALTAALTALDGARAAGTADCDSDTPMGATA